MSRKAWLTLDDFPGSTITLAFTIPNDESWKAQLRGALVPLIYSENFEPFGELSANEMADYWRDIVLQFFEEVPLIVPGMVIEYAGEFAPDGWLLCDGRTLNGDDYPGLFAAIGYTYGSVPGDSSLFKLPDRVGRVGVGATQGVGSPYPLGSYGGAKNVTLTTGQVPTHYHQFNIEFGAGSSGALAVKGSGVGIQVANTTSIGGGQSHPNEQPYVVFNYIIKT